MSLQRVLAPLEKWAQRVSSNPNLVPEERAFFKLADADSKKTMGEGTIFLKKPGDRNIFMGYVGASATLALITVVGIFNLATGTGKKPERPPVTY